jgi:ubiquinone/menaquinone biosynthesis C-methylase UbiE
MINMDITDLHFPDNFFDSILCYHVLEHVPADYKALHELHRVLKPGGWAILQVPLKSGPTIEGTHIIDPEERTRLFGQADHVRYYGDDYKQRLESKGFIVRVDSYAAELPLAVRIRNALPMEDIYYCTKPAC